MRKIALICGVIAATLSLGIAARADTVYLSDLPFKVAGLHGIPNNGYFDAVRVNDAASIKTMKGTEPSDFWDKPTMVNGQAYSKELTFHMIRDGTMMATWNLGGKYKSLDAMVAMDDDQGVPGTYPDVTVKFIGDGKVLQTANLHIEYGKSNPTPAVSVDLSNVKMLMISVTMVHAESSNVDIINPQLTTRR